MIKAVKKKESEPNFFNKKWEPLVYLVPFAIGLLIFTIYPIVNVVVMSFKNGYRLSGAFTGWGLENYTKVIGDRNFRSAIVNTFKYVFTVVPVATVLSIIIANLLNQKIKGIALFQTAFFLPLVTSTIAVGTVFKYMFNTNYGLFNWVIQLFGGTPIEWLNLVQGQTDMNIWVVIIFGIWNTMPFTIILLLSGLQNIDPLYYTAAQVDGASSTKQFFRITVPLLAPTIFLTMIVNMISAFKVYNDVIPFWNGSAGVTGRNMYTIVYYIKEQFYSNHRLGIASAAAILLFLIIFVFTMLQRYIQSKFDN